MLKKIAEENGMTLFGVADISNIKSEFLLDKSIIEKMNFGISIGYRLSGKILETISDRPNQIYFFHYQRVNLLLDLTALKIAQFIQSQNFNAVPVPASQIVDWKNMKGLLLHKKVAYLAGHGWIGKNNLLVNPSFGSQVRYATILTDMPFPLHSGTSTIEVGKPIEGGCGECRKCIEACPANAIGDDFFNIDLCIGKMKELCRKENISQLICGVCVKVCDGKMK